MELFRVGRCGGAEEQALGRQRRRRVRRRRRRRWGAAAGGWHLPAKWRNRVGQGKGERARSGPSGKDGGQEAAEALPVLARRLAGQLGVALLPSQFSPAARSRALAGPLRRGQHLHIGPPAPVHRAGDQAARRQQPRPGAGRGKRRHLRAGVEPGGAREGERALSGDIGQDGGQEAVIGFAGLCAGRPTRRRAHSARNFRLVARSRALAGLLRPGHSHIVRPRCTAW